MERELKESNNIFFLNLIDNRKLLFNYNYNNNLEYNHFIAYFSSACGQWLNNS